MGRRNPRIIASIYTNKLGNTSAIIQNVILLVKFIPTHLRQQHSPDIPISNTKHNPGQVSYCRLGWGRHGAYTPIPTIAYVA